MSVSKNRQWCSSAFFIAAVYCVIGLLWIALSDRAAGLFTDFMHIQTIKGWLYVIVTSIILYFLIRRQINRYRGSAEHLRISNRHLEILSLCNKTLVHAENETMLLEVICDVITIIGGYRYIIIGFHDGNNTPGVHITAWRGFDQGFINDVRTIGEQKNRFDSPLVLSMISNETIIENDLVLTPHKSVFTESLIRQGIRSLLTLPLVNGQGAFGVIGFFAAEPNTFSEDERDLLTVFAEDISYGIQSLRTKKDLIDTMGALRENEKKYRTLFDGMSVGALIQSANGAIVSANIAAMDILGLSEEQLPEWSLRDPRWRSIREDGTEYSPETHPFLAALKTGREIRNSFVGIFNPRRAKYHWLLVNTTPMLHNGDQTPYQAFTTFQDISDLTQLRGEMLRLSGEMQAIIDAAPLAIFDLDKESRVRSLWNTAAERIFGWTREEVIGKPLPIVPDERKVEFDHLHDLLMNGQSFTGIELHRVRKDGTPIVISSATAPLKDTQGVIIGIMVIAADVTEHAKLKQQFLHAQKMEAVGRLAGGVAHDFNNLLTVILGNIGMILMNCDHSDERFSLLEEVETTAQRATMLTRQLLSFSRKQAAESQTVLINNVLEDMNKMLRRLIGEDIELIVRLDSAAGSVNIDIGQFEQVITNLIVNARDAMPQGGKLFIETSTADLEEADEFGIITGKRQEYVLISVSDTGCGMDKETLEHIFEPFFTTKEHGKGTGLGLTTCYGIVKQHGGVIRVYSEPGSGTSFKIYIPKAQNGDKTKTPDIATEQPMTGTETILLVEDEPSVRRVAANILKQIGYTIIEAPNGEEGLHTAKEYGLDRIDLLLTDVIMPKMGGKELSQQLMELKPALKVLFMSGYTGVSIENSDLLRDSSHFIQKPFSKNTLAKKIRDVLDENG